MKTESLPFALLAEDDYAAAMETDCAAWLREQVQTQVIKSFDDVTLYAYYAIPEGAKTCIVMVHGFCEFFGKYHEMAWYLYRAGYAFCFLEQRGHGHSGGKLKETDVVYVDSFDTYVLDLHAFIKQVVRVHCADMEWVLFAHSMGGAVSALFLETYPDMFSKALLSSPMFAWRSLKISRPLCSLIAFAAKVTHREKTLAPAEKHFDEMEAFETSSMQSRARYDYTFALRMNDADNRSYGASIGWGVAALRGMSRLMDNAGKIRLPVTIFAAGEDGLVDVESFKQFQKKVPQTEILWYESSRHEIYNALDAERMRFYADLFAHVRS